VNASAHLRGIVIAGVLAAVALALGFVTLTMNQTASQAAPKVIKPLHPRSAAKTAAAKAGKAKTGKAKTVKSKPNAHVVAALAAGLPQAVAAQFATHSVVVVELASQRDQVSMLAAGEAKAGAKAAGAGFVAINVDVDGLSSKLTTALGKLPSAPAALVYVRPATVANTLVGFVDRTAVQQAITSAESSAAAAAAAAAASPAAASPAVTGAQ
jgi:hypothetical protein